MLKSFLGTRETMQLNFIQNFILNFYYLKFLGLFHVY